MLAVIAIHKDIIDVLDTDDGVVERVSFDDVDNLHVHLTGFTSKKGLGRFLENLNGGMDFQHVTVFWDNAFIYDFWSSVSMLQFNCKTHYNSDYLSIFKELNTINIPYVIGRIVVYLLMMKNCDDSSSIVFCFNGDRFIFDKDDVESYLILCLYVIKYKLYDSFKILCNGVDVTFDFNLIERDAVIFTKDSVTLFCDNRCVLKVKNSILDSVGVLHDRLVTKTKAFMLKDSNLSLLTDECIINGSKEYKTLTLDKDLNYSIMSSLKAETLRLINPNLKLKICPSCNLSIRNVYVVSKYKSVMKALNNCLSVQSLKSYSVTSNLIDYDFINKKLLGLNIVFNVIDIDNADKAVNFVKTFIGDNILDSIRSGETIFITSYRQVKLIMNSNIAGFLPDDYKELLSLKGWVSLSAVGVCDCGINRYSWFKRDIAIYIQFHYKDKIHNTYSSSEMRDKVYNEILDDINKIHSACADVAVVTGLPIHISNSKCMCVSCKFDNLSGYIDVHNLEEYTMFQKYNMGINYIIDEFEARYGLSVSMKPHSTTVDKFYVEVSGFKRGKDDMTGDVPIVVAERICRESGVHFKLSFHGHK